MAKKLNNRISDDLIITEILPRLPVKFLCQFKCVSKPWRSLISSERFVKAHLQSYSFKFPRILFDCGLKHCSLNPLIKNSHSEEEVEVINIDNLEKDISRNVTVIGSVNGLICLSISCGLFPDYYLLNPCTREYKKLPPVDELTDWSSMTDQFVYTAVDDDYKVIFFYAKIGELQANIYSWRANSWKTPVSIKANVTLSHEQIFVAGKIHFGIYDQGLNLAEEGVPPPILFDIAFFDLETGLYGEIEQPDYGDGVKILSLAKLGGWFCVFCLKQNRTDWWVMKEHGVKKSWTKMFTVSLLAHPVAILPPGVILMEFNSSLMVCNLADNSSRALNTTKFGRFRAAYHLVESLVSPTQHERMGRQEENQ